MRKAHGMTSDSKRLPTFAPCGLEGRRPERIDELLSALAVYWRDHPQQRLGQILYNFATSLAEHYNLRDGFGGIAVREVEDEALLGMLNTGMPYPPLAARLYLYPPEPTVH